MTATQLAERIGARVQGDGAIQLAGCATLEAAGPTDLTFLANRRYHSQLKTTKAGAVVLNQQDAADAGDRTVLIADDPYFAFRNAMVALVGFRQHAFTGISPQAIIDPQATIGKDCTIGPYAVIEANAVIGDRTVIYPHCFIGRAAQVGDDCQLYANVVVYDRCVVGNRVTLHAGCVIGQDGFGYASAKAPDEKEVRHHKIPQSGNAVVEDDVEMGALCSVDRATLGSTVVGRGTKFSNSVTIGHGTKVGRHNLFVAQVGLAGSVQTGDYVVMGGQVGIAGHLKIGHGVRIAATSGVMRDAPDGQEIGGTPAMPLTEKKREFLNVAKLPRLMDDVRDLKKRLAALEKNLQNAEPISREKE